MNASLRPATGEDEAFLFELYASTRREEVAAWGWSEPQRQAFLAMQHAAQRKGYAARFPRADHRIIEAGGRAVGRLLVDRSGREIRLVDIALVPEARGQGIGSRLIGQLLDEAERGARPVRLQVLAGSRAQELYGRLGFRVMAQEPPYLEMEWAATRGRPPAE